MTSACIDTGIFFCLAFKEPGFKYCKKILDDLYFKKVKGVISSIQLSELYTPFRRAGDIEGLEKMKMELSKLGLKIRGVDKDIAELSSVYRAEVKTPEGKWLPLADSIILATAKSEEVDILYTIDIDFYNVKDVEVKGPGMNLIEWVKRYGSNRQKKILGLL